MESNHDKFLLRRELTRMYVEYSPRLIKVAMRYVRDIEVARDIVSDSFISVWTRMDTLPLDINKPAYLMVVVKNKCINYLKAQQNHLRIYQDMHSVQSGLISENLRSLEAFDPEIIFTEELKELIDKSLDQMSKDIRTIFEMSRYEGKTYQEISQELGITVRKVTSKIQKALSILRVYLKDYLPIAIIFYFFS